MLRLDISQHIYLGTVGSHVEENLRNWWREMKQKRWPDFDGT